MSRKPTSKIFTMIAHEYTTKIKSKGFIIGTLLGPIFMIALIAIPGIVAYFSADATEKKIAIVDMTNDKIGEQIIARDDKKYFLSYEEEEKLKEQVLSEQLDGYFIITDEIIESGRATVFTRGGGGIGFITSLEGNVGDVIKVKRLKDAGANERVLELVNTRFKINTVKLTEQGEQKDFTEIYAGIGYVLGFVIYMLMFMYGSYVSRGVIEEKANRIIEVLASSAKPFEIMMGKVVGIGLVGLTQVLVWIILVALGLFITAQFFAGSITPEQAMTMANPTGMSNMNAIPIGGGIEIPNISPWLGVAFIYYFLIGYFIYATLFAAVGSAVDQEADAAQLQTPITLPILIPILFIFNIMSNPDGTLAIVLSLIPFFSPILMIVRIAATDVPAWQIIASVVLTIGTFFACLAIAAKIYRVGILMYGKKPTFKDLFKWIRLAK